MCDTENLYRQWFDKLNSKIIKIIENGERMHHLRPNAVGGYFQPLQWEDGILHGELLIDNQMSAEEKLNTLFHEMGHVQHYQEVGQDRSQDTSEKFAIEAELHAFKYQLKMIIQTVQECDVYILRFTINQFLDRLKTESDPIYQDALRQLMEDPLWSEAKKLIAK